MKIHHPLHLFALILTAFAAGFLLSGILKDYEATGHSETVFIVLLALACLSLVSLVSLGFRKAPFRNSDR
ncbi:hypothetical protein [Hymenobacter aerophilus]|uniref:hypothetical protein n=1 Tax=Hymenobacter aerophilus TaxID=119644 RepID=UPI00036B4FB7|nr:hypothetical protein [Hymenobacter aerophilus]